MQVRYYISSADLSAEKFATAMKGHWSIENKLHWRLDVAMNEDDCRIRRGDAAELFSGRRHIAVNILSANKEFKAGLRRKMRRAAMDRKYLASVLAGCGFRNLSLRGELIRSMLLRLTGDICGIPALLTQCNLHSERLPDDNGSFVYQLLPEWH